MQISIQTIRAFFIALLLQVFLELDAGAQDQCPQPRVKVANDMDYYNQQQRNDSEHNKLALNTAVANSIIAQNTKSIRFFSAFTAAIPVGEVDYYLTVGSDPSNAGVHVLIKLTDNNNRVVLRNQSMVNDPLWVENTNNIAPTIAKEVTPLINKIKDHQHLIRNTTKAAISSKFELEKRSYVVKVSEKKSVTFVLKDCDDVVLPFRTVILELEGKGKIDRTTCTVDENGIGEFTYSAPEDNGQATVTLAHQYEDVAGNDNRFSVDAINFNTSGKLWLLVNHVTESAEIYIVGEHIGQLEMNWNSDNTRGGIIAAFSTDEDNELWSSYLVGYIEMTIKQTGDNIWTISSSWIPGSTKINTMQKGGYELEILWPMEDGSTFPVQGTITFEKPDSFDQARKKYLAAKRGTG